MSVTCSECSTAAGPADRRCSSCGTHLPLEPGCVVAGRFEVLAELGSGGMGSVFRARDDALRVEVALKVLRLHDDPHARQRFLSEVKLARQVKHRNVCALYEYGEDDDIVFCTMELVEGRTLRQLFRETGPLEWERAYRIALQVAEGLRAIHEAGVIHRDLKASNAMLGADGVVRLVDFGIAKALRQRRLQDATPEITTTGRLVGSPEYMSPEQIRSEPIDARSDIYSFGVLLYEMFTGRVPFRAETPVDTMIRHLQEPPPLDGLAAMTLPRSAVPILRRALAKQAEDRQPDARTLIAELESAKRRLVEDTTDPLRPSSPPPSRGGWLRPVAGAGVGAALVAAIALSLYRAGPPRDPAPPPRTLPASTTTLPPPPTTPSTTTTALTPPPTTRPATPTTRPATPTTLPPTPTTLPPTPTTLPGNAAQPEPPPTATPPTTTTTTLPSPPPDLCIPGEPDVEPAKCIDCLIEWWPAALRTRARGTVEVEVVVDEQGNVAEAVPKKGEKLLLDNALDYLPKWRYLPARWRGQPCRTRFIQPVEFPAG